MVRYILVVSAGSARSRASAAKRVPGRRGLYAWNPRKGHYEHAFLVTEWCGSSRPAHLLKQIAGKGPLWPGKQGTTFALGARQSGALIKIRLRTVHPNPGPGRRRGRRGQRTEEEKRVRNERRREKKRLRRARGEEPEGQFLKVVTWNLQGMSMREQYR